MAKNPLDLPLELQVIATLSASFPEAQALYLGCRRCMYTSWGRGGVDPRGFAAFELLAPKMSHVPWKIGYS